MCCTLHLTVTLKLNPTSVCSGSHNKDSAKEAFLEHSPVSSTKLFLFFFVNLFIKYFSLTVYHINFVFCMKDLNPNKYFKINYINRVLERGQLTSCCSLIRYDIIRRVVHPLEYRNGTQSLEHDVG